MEYLAQDPKSGRYRYRRRVPGELIKLIAKREFSVPLKTADQCVALERYEHVHKDDETEIAAVRAIDPADADHLAMLQTLRKYELVTATQKSLSPVSFEADFEKFSRFTDADLRAPDHEFDRIVEEKFHGLQAFPLRLSKAVGAYLEENSVLNPRRMSVMPAASQTCVLDGTGIKPSSLAPG